MDATTAVGWGTVPDVPPADTEGNIMKTSTTRTWSASRDRGSDATAQMRHYVYNVHAAAGLLGDRPGTVRCAFSGAVLAIHRDLGTAYGLPVAEVDRLGASEGSDHYAAGDLVFAHPYVNGTLRNARRVGPDAMARAERVAAGGQAVDVATAKDARGWMRATVGAATAEVHADLAARVAG